MTRFFGGLLLVLTVAAFASAVPRVRRLAGGDNAQTGQYPYMAAVRFDGKLVCGGAIISPNKILTAANCIDRCLRVTDPGFKNCKTYMTIYTGSASLSKGGSVSRVKSVKVPDNFALGKFAHDLGIITLETPIKLTANEKVADLPTKEFDENSVGVSSGWGASAKEGKVSDGLQILKETLISSAKCAPIFEGKGVKVDANDFCGVALPGAEKAGLCIGDSGNPIVQDGKVIGISTWGIGCAEGYPDVFTSVYNHLDFVKSELL